MNSWRTIVAATIISILALPLFAEEIVTLKSTPLGELTPNWARQRSLGPKIDRSFSDGPLQIGDRKFARGIGTHANSVLGYDLGGAFEGFEAWVGVYSAVKFSPCYSGFRPLR
jgi:hypothetical protein